MRSRFWRCRIRQCLFLSGLFIAFYISLGSSSQASEEERWQRIESKIDSLRLGTLDLGFFVEIGKKYDEILKENKEVLQENQRLREQLKDQGKTIVEKIADLERKHQEDLDRNIHYFNLKLQAFENRERARNARPGTTVKELMDVGYGNGYVTAYLMEDGSIRACGSSDQHANGSGADIYLPQTISIDPLSPPTGKFKSVRAGHVCFFALTEGGDAYSWGYNTQGQLGHGTANNLPYAKRIQFFTNHQLKVSHVMTCANYDHSYGSTFFIADSQDGTRMGDLYATGFNGGGQLGDGTLNQCLSPVRCGHLTSVKQVVASVSSYGMSVYAIVGDNNSLYSWGANGQGQLGHNDTVGRHAPTLVQYQGAPLSGVRKVVTVGGHVHDSKPSFSYAMILLNGEVLACGFNAYGQLGTNDNTDRHIFTPVRIVGNPNSIHAIDIEVGGGYYGSSALLDDKGNLYTWGYNEHGQLGHGDTFNRNAPNLIPKFTFPDETIKKFKFSGDHSGTYLVILTTNGVLWGAGYNGHGQLGLHNGKQATNPTISRLMLPFSDINEESKVKDFVCFGYYGDGSTLALTEDGRVFASGHNAHGQCGTHVSNLQDNDAFYTVLF